MKTQLTNMNKHVVSKGGPFMRWKQVMQNVLAWYLLLAALYLAVTFLSPVPHKTLQHYHLTLLAMRFIDLAIVVPLIAIWGAAFYGYFKLSQYARLVKRGDDGKAVRKLSYGVLFLALWLPVSSIISSVLKDVAIVHPNFTTPSVVAHDYLSLLLPLVGFLFISEGARDFSELAKHRPGRRAIYAMGLIIITVGVIYSYLVTNTQNRLNAAYHLDTAMVLITLVIPYIFMWFLGMLASYEIYNYHLRVKGILYSRSLGLLAYGMGAMIITSIFLQYLTTLSSRLSALSLNWILALIYVLLIILAFSFILIALGAKRLQKIEEV
jgi:hypothetical protein